MSIMGRGYLRIRRFDIEEFIGTTLTFLVFHYFRKEFWDFILVDWYQNLSGCVGNFRYIVLLVKPIMFVNSESPENQAKELIGFSIKVLATTKGLYSYVL